jgi:hypothetical protein
MTDTAKSNYGVLLKKGDGATPTEAFTAIGQVVSIDPPEFIAEVVESTNHNSGGYKEFVSSGLKELTEFSAIINFISADVTVFTGLITSGVATNFQLTFPTATPTVWNFSAIVKKVKPMTADAQSPEAMQAEITFQPSGAPTF